MDLSKLTRLRQAKIERPCPEEWDKMDGDDRQRFCSGCGCFVHNIEALGAQEAEELLSSPGRVCTRQLIDNARGILTRDGWIPRLLAAGAVASTAAGCYQTTTGEAAVPSSPPPVSKKSVAAAKPKEEVKAADSSARETLGWPAIVADRTTGVMPLTEPDEKPAKKKRKKH